MKNKKLIFTLLFAVIVAFILAVLICKTPHKPVRLEKPQKENTQETIIEDVTPTQPPQKEEPEKKIEPAKVQPRVKPIKRPAALPKASQPPVKEAETVQPDTGKAEPVQELEAKIPEQEGVVVPVEYKSKSVYKYVYTPVRYNKK